MSTNRDVERIVRSWMDEGVTQLPDRVLDLVLDQVPATPQRRATWWPVRRYQSMNRMLKFGLAAAAVAVIVIVGYQLLPGSNRGVGGPSGQPSATTFPAASPAAIAMGSFISHGAQTELDATGEGSNVTGSMTVTDEGGRFTVDLACTRTTDSGLIAIGGPVTDSTNNEIAPKGSNVAIVLQRGSPVTAFFWLEHPDPHEASCPAFLESIPDVAESGYDPAALEPINGTIELRP